MYVGVFVFYLEVKRRKWDIENLMFAMSGCFIGATAGSLLFNTLLFGSDDTLKKIFDFDISGMSVLGGILGGFIGVEFFKIIIGHKKSTGDAFAVAIPIGHLIGRIGCLLGGCCTKSCLLGRFCRKWCLLGGFCTKWCPLGGFCRKWKLQIISYCKVLNR